MHGDKRSENSSFCRIHTKRFTWIYFFYLWINRIDLRFNSSRKSKGDMCEVSYFKNISVFLEMVCVCVCVKTSYMVSHMDAIAKYIAWKKQEYHSFLTQCSRRTWKECLE